MVTRPPPFNIEIYNGSYVALGDLGNPLSVTVVPRHNRVRSLSVTVGLDNNQIGNLLARESRLVCHYKDEQEFSGPIRPFVGSGPWKAGEVTFTAESDERLLGRLLGYPVPGANLAGQNVLLDKRTGPAETVLKGFVEDNLTGPSRWPAHQLISVATDLGRGSTITAAIGMQPLADVLIALLDQSGIGFRVTQLPGNGNGLELDVYETGVYPEPLSELAGSVQSWTWQRTPPEATRAIIGGPADDVTGIRPWSVAIASATETAYRDVIEVMVDAASEDNATARLALGHAALAELAEKNGVSVTLNDTDNFHFGGADGVHVGDLVTIDIGDEQIPDTLREAAITWDHDTGFKATPVAGELQTPAKKQASVLDRIARKLRALTAKS